MRCLQLPSSLLPLPMHAKLECQQHLEQTKLLWLTTNDLTRTVSQSRHFPSPSPLRTKTKALPHSIVVAATSPPKSGDISVFLPVSALLLSVYFIANFIVPEFISKYFGFDKANEDQKVDDVNAKEDK